MTNKNVTMIQKLDKSITDSIDTDQDWYIIENPDSGRLLADSTYLRKWLMKNGLDELLTVSVIDVVAAKWIAELDADSHTLIARATFSGESVHVAHD